MRTIKFRAWDGKQMILHDSLFEFQRQNLTKEELEKVTYLQFTGLKDKNGKEIYEQDLIALDESVMSDTGEDKPNYIEKNINPNFKYADGTVGERRYGREIKLVEWKDSNCGFEPFSDSDANCGHCGGGIKASDVEVVGNVYENPELLKGDK